MNCPDCGDPMRHQILCRLERDEHWWVCDNSECGFDERIPYIDDAEE